MDTRLAEIEQEKQQLLALREELQRPKPPTPASDSLSPEQKIAIFRMLFRGRTDIFANRWQNQQGRSGYSVACNNEWVKGICNKPRIKCQDCTHRQFSELSDQVIYRHLAGHVRRNCVYENLASIEIETSKFADVHDNEMSNNSYPAGPPGLQRFRDSHA